MGGKIKDKSDSLVKCFSHLKDGRRPCVLESVRFFILM